MVERHAPTKAVRHRPFNSLCLLGVLCDSVVRKEAATESRTTLFAALPFEKMPGDLGVEVRQAAFEAGA